MKKKAELPIRYIKISFFKRLFYTNVKEDISNRDIKFIKKKKRGRRNAGRHLANFRGRAEQLQEKK